MHLHGLLMSMSPLLTYSYITYVTEHAVLVLMVVVLMVAEIYTSGHAPLGTPLPNKGGQPGTSSLENIFLELHASRRGAHHKIQYKDINLLGTYFLLFFSTLRYSLIGVDKT